MVTTFSRVLIGCRQCLLWTLFKKKKTQYAVTLSAFPLFCFSSSNKVFQKYLISISSTIFIVMSYHRKSTQSSTCIQNINGGQLWVEILPFKKKYFHLFNYIVDIYFYFYLSYHSIIMLHKWHQVLNI